MRWLVVTLALMLLGLQYRLWFGEGSFAQKTELSREVREQQLKNTEQRQRNRVLAEEVKGLKIGLEAVEGRARIDLGMIGKGETFYLVVDEPVKKQWSEDTSDNKKNVSPEQPTVVEPRDSLPVDLSE